MSNPNLPWCAKLTSEQVLNIRREFAEGYWPDQIQAAFHYGITQPRISDIINRKTYKNVD